MKIDPRVLSVHRFYLFARLLLYLFSSSAFVFSLTITLPVLLPSKDIACFLADAYLQFLFPIYLPHLTHLTSMSRLIHLPLQRLGKNYFCLCMIHNDKFFPPRPPFPFLRFVF